MEPYDILLRRIKQGEFAVGTRLTPERQLAEELQVSRAAIQRALARLGEEGWIEARHGFRPVVRAAVQTSTETVPATAYKTIALLMGSETSYKPFAQILRGCELELRRHGYLLVFLDTWAETVHDDTERGDREKETLAYISGQMVNGVILWCQAPKTSLPLLKRLRTVGIEIVTIDREIASAEFDHVGVDNFRAARQVVNYLVQKNHRQIAFATEQSEPASTVQQRIEGFQFGLLENGIPFSEHSFLRFPFRATVDQLVKQLGNLKESRKMPTALFAVNDFYAWRIIRALRQLGLSVPEDVSVVGFDDMEPPSEEEGFLTTVRQPFSDIGRLAARNLVQRLAEPESPLRQILLTTSLIQRSSVRTSAAAHGSLSAIQPSFATAAGSHRQ